MDALEKEKYTLLFKEVQKFKGEQTKQKLRGLNDYNILTTVLKAHDETRLHSRMIGSFLNIQGSHYQDDLFLDLFLETVGIKNYDTKNSKIYLEYTLDKGSIDIYLTDGIKHIIIENKIWARDQESQIKRYIEGIKNKNLFEKDLYVIYLSVDRLVASNYSLGDLKIENGYIINEDGEQISHFININYKNEILTWLEKCQYEVQNITNLNEAIRQYIDVIKLINGENNKKVKQMKELLLKDNNLELAIELHSAIVETKIEVQTKFWEALQKKLLDSKYNFEFVNHRFKNADIAEKCSNYYKGKEKDIYYGLKYDIKSIDKNHKLSFYIEADNNVCYGLTFSKDDTREPIAKDTIFESISNLILSDNIAIWKNTNKDKKQIWWLCRKLPEEQLNFKIFNSEEIFNLTREINEANITSVDKIASEIVEILKKVETLVNK